MKARALLLLELLLLLASLALANAQPKVTYISNTVYYTEEITARALGTLIKLRVRYPGIILWNSTPLNVCLDVTLEEHPPGAVVKLKDIELLELPSGCIAPVNGSLVLSANSSRASVNATIAPSTLERALGVCLGEPLGGYVIKRARLVRAKATVRVGRSLKHVEIVGPKVYLLAIQRPGAVRVVVDGVKVVQQILGAELEANISLVNPAKSHALDVDVKGGLFSGGGVLWVRDREQVPFIPPGGSKRLTLKLGLAPKPNGSGMYWVRVEYENSATGQREGATVLFEVLNSPRGQEVAQVSEEAKSRHKEGSEAPAPPATPGFVLVAPLAAVAAAVAALIARRQGVTPIQVRELIASHTEARVAGLRELLARNQSSKPDVVVDGSNVVLCGSKEGIGTLKNLKLVLEELAKNGKTFIVVLDAATRHKVLEEEQLEELLSEGLILQAPAGGPADEFILEYAKRTGAYILSNDEFREYADAYPDERRRKIRFMIIGDQAILKWPSNL